MSENQSEVARLRAHIEQENQAAWWALHGLSSGTAQHAFITRRFNHMEQSYKRLMQVVGEEEATRMVCEVFDRKEGGDEKSGSI